MGHVWQVTRIPRCRAFCGHESCLALKEAALTFHSNGPSLPSLLQKRGLEFGRPGELALFGAYRARGTGPPSRRSEPDSDVDPNHRAVVELRQFRTCRELSDKRLLALHLKNTACDKWAPVTFLSPEELNAAFGNLKADTTLFFLKHAHRERNEGVSVHLGIEACCKAWQSLPPQERPLFLAQQEVPDVLLDAEGRKITLRIYLLLLFVDGDSRTALALARRKFICRSHPLKYDAEDPSPGRHVYSTLDTFKDVDGFTSTSWHHSDAIWPEVVKMFQATSKPIQSFRRSCTCIVRILYSLAYIILITVMFFSRDASLMGRCDQTRFNLQASIAPFLSRFAALCSGEGRIEPRASHDR